MFSGDRHHPELYCRSSGSQVFNHHSLAGHSIIIYHLFSFSIQVYCYYFSNSDAMLWGFLYDLTYYSSLIEDVQGNGHLGCKHAINDNGGFTFVVDVSQLKSCISKSFKWLGNYQSLICMSISISRGVVTWLKGSSNAFPNFHQIHANTLQVLMWCVKNSPKKKKEELCLKKSSIS